MKTFYFRLMTVFLSIAMLLAGVELVLRVGGNTTDPVSALDVASSSFEEETGRDHPWTSASTSHFCVVVVGDSFASGSGVHETDRYADRLERYLNMNTGVPPARVDVIARSRTSTFQQLEFIKEALALRPDVLILGICLNDTEDWAQPKEILRWRKERMLPQAPPAWLGPLVRHSILLKWIHRKSQVLPMRKAFYQYYERLYDKQYTGWRRFEKSIEQAADLCREADVPLVGMVFPLLSHDLRRGHYPFLRMHEAIRAVFTEAEVPLLDLLDTFYGMDPNRMQAIPNIDPHPSEIAHRMAADALLRYLVDEDFVDGAYLPRRQKAVGGRRIALKIEELYTGSGERDL